MNFELLEISDSLTSGEWGGGGSDFAVFDWVGVCRGWGFGVSTNGGCYIMGYPLDVQFCLVGLN